MRERPCPEEYGRSLMLFLPVDHSFKGRQDTGAGITAGGYKAFGILYEIRIVSCFTVREIDQDRGFLIPLCPGIGKNAVTVRHDILIVALSQLTVLSAKTGQADIIITVVSTEYRLI